MRKIALCVAFLLIPVAAFCQEQWKEFKSTHFIVFYHDAAHDFIERVSAESERCYGRITQSLGFLRHDFWLWENRARIYIYDDAGEYQSCTGVPAWSAGAAIPRDKVIHTFQGKEGFFENVLPHEIGHIIFREFVGFDNPAVPGWLDEGAASYQEDSGLVRAVRAGYIRLSGNTLSLARLSAIDPHQLTDRQAVEMFYAQAVGLIDFLIGTFGRDAFVLFCRSLRDTRNLNKALSFAFSIRGMDDLEERWQAHLK